MFFYIVILLLFLLYRYSTRTFKYWKVRGIKHDKPIPIFGNNLSSYLVQKSITQLAMEMYLKYPEEKVVGFFRGSKPELIIRDPEIVKRILTTDFSYFQYRGLNFRKEMNPLLRNLVFFEGDDWRLVRHHTSPAFSPSKVKAMFPLICANTELLVATLSTTTDEEKGKVMDAYNVMASYTIDCIGSVGFGLKTDCISNENSAFRKLGHDIFNRNVVQIIVETLKYIFPKTFKYLPDMNDFEKKIFNLVNEIQKQRNYEPSGRNDFMDFLLELKRKGPITGESTEKKTPDGLPAIVTIDIDTEFMIGQVFMFFAAGFETSSSTASFTLHQLALHLDIQKKVQDEVDEVLKRYDKKLSYDSIKEMKYLKWAFLEAMRLFPSIGFLIRECTKEYTIPEVNVTIDSGVGIMIPVQSLHTDPKYFDNPQEFQPERFRSNDFRKSFVYLPFGGGPRVCIGARLGEMQSLAGLAALLSKFTVEPAPETLRYPVVDPKYFVIQGIKGGLPLLFKKRTNVCR